MTTRAQLQASDAKAFILAGNARVTLVSQKTGARFTYRVRADRKGGPRHYVAVLTGSDNESAYTFLGTIFDGQGYAHGRRSTIGPDAPSAKAWEYAWHHILTGEPMACEVWHEGSCGKCGRPLTVPESIARGLGPVCAGGG